MSVQNYKNVVVLYLKKEVHDGKRHRISLTREQSVLPFF